MEVCGKAVSIKTLMVTRMSKYEGTMNDELGRAGTSSPAF
jgi:hypothetical protein